MRRFTLNQAMDGTNKPSEQGRNSEKSIYSIPPYYYLHVLDEATNVTRVETGPKTYALQENEHVIFGPEKMVIIPPCHFCVIENPVVRNAENALVFDNAGQIKLCHADQEVRLQQDPFPLYPGEFMLTEVTPLTVVSSNSALRLKALRDFNDGKMKRVAGDEWLFEGPGTFVPRKEVKVLETVSAVVIHPNQALKLRACTETKDRDGVDRVTGEEWIVKKMGAYLPGAYEEVVGVVNAYILTETEAVHVKAKKTFVDDFFKTRKNGDEWLITKENTEIYIPAVYEDVQGIVNITVLNNRQYCVIIDPADANGKPQLGRKKLVKGEKSFFLLPGERLEAGIQDVYVLSENQGLILRARKAFQDTGETPVVNRIPGEHWMIKGPTEYIPPIEVEIVAKRFAIALDQNEGIYVRNIKSGQVRLVRGSTYMLTHDEELWVKELPPQVEELINESIYGVSDAAAGSSKRVMKSKQEGARAVTLHVPNNACIQIYDYKQKQSRVVFGPDFVILAPDEQFTQLSISGDKPKRPNVIKTLYLPVGPDFCTDIISVVTADHARFLLELSYNWYFEVGDKNPTNAAKLFSVPDFIGYMCKEMASRIGSVVASTNFYDLKNLAKIIRTAVFGIDENKKVRKTFNFPQNNLFISSVDILTMKPDGYHTQSAMEKSIAIVVTRSQEATAKHEEDRREQEALSRLERQRISDELEVAASRKSLLELNARAKSDAMEIQIAAAVSRLEKLAAFDTERIKHLCNFLGNYTVGTEFQIEILQSLGIQSIFSTDGKRPIDPTQHR